jgi:hypothetical protein
MAGQLNAVLEALKLTPSTASELRRHCTSRKAVITAIYRLREQGHDIITVPAGTRNGEATFHLRRLANDLRDWTYSPAEMNG